MAASYRPGGRNDRPPIDCSLWRRLSPSLSRLATRMIGCFWDPISPTNLASNIARYSAVVSGSRHTLKRGCCSPDWEATPAGIGWLWTVVPTADRWRHYRAATIDQSVLVPMSMGFQHPVGQLACGQVVSRCFAWGGNDDDRPTPPHSGTAVPVSVWVPTPHDQLCHQAYAFCFHTHFDTPHLCGQ